MTTKSATFQELAGTFPKKRPKKPVSTEQIKEVVRMEAVRRFKKSVAKSVKITPSVSEGGRSNQQ